MNLIFFFFLNCRQRLKRRRLILVRLSLMNMRPLGWALLRERSRCLWLNTASLVFLEQNLAMMAGCGFLSEAGDSLWETLISSAFKSTPTIFETRRIRWVMSKHTTYFAAIIKYQRNVLIHMTWNPGCHFRRLELVRTVLSDMEIKVHQEPWSFFKQYLPSAFSVTFS